MIPVLVVDVTEAETDKIFASRDPLAGIATLETQSEAVEETL